MGRNLTNEFSQGIAHPQSNGDLDKEAKNAHSRRTATYNTTASVSNDSSTELYKCKCGYKAQSPYKFCPECGEKVEANLPKFCPECGWKNSNNSKFCPECGNKF